MKEREIEGEEERERGRERVSACSSQGGKEAGRDGGNDVGTDGEKGAGEGSDQERKGNGGTLTLQQPRVTEPHHSMRLVIQQEMHRLNLSADSIFGPALVYECRLEREREGVGVLPYLLLKPRPDPCPDVGNFQGEWGWGADVQHVAFANSPAKSRSLSAGLQRKIPYPNPKGRGCDIGHKVIEDHLKRDTLEPTPRTRSQ